MPAPVILPAFSSSKTSVLRSGFTLLRKDNDHCLQGEPIAYCHLSATSVDPSDQLSSFKNPHLFDFFAVILAPTSGIIHWNPGISKGGWMDQLIWARPSNWSNAEELAKIESIPASSSQSKAPEESLIFSQGERVVPWADVRGALLPGWYDSIRSWSATGELQPTTIATACAYRYAVLGQHRCADQFITRRNSSTHLSYLMEGLFLPTSTSLLEELTRSEEQKSAIVNEIQKWYPTLQEVDRAQSASLIANLQSRIIKGSSLFHNYPVLQLNGVTLLKKSPQIVLSLDCEEARTYQHKELGFTLSISRIMPLNKDFARILREKFILLPEPTAEQIGEQYEKISNILQQHNSRLFVINSLLREPGAPLLRPAWGIDVATTHCYRVRLLNELLINLEEKKLLTVIDIDRTISALGVTHIPDGVHGDASIEEAVRNLLLTKVM